jgi:hypothetical protein
LERPVKAMWSKPRLCSAFLIKAEFSFLNLAISAETDEGEAGEGAGTGWEAALPRKMLLVDCLTAGSMVVRQAMREVSVLEARVEWVPS